jgi:hypothetical protein
MDAAFDDHGRSQPAPHAHPYQEASRDGLDVTFSRAAPVYNGVGACRHRRAYRSAYGGPMSARAPHICRAKSLDYCFEPTLKMITISTKVT